MLQLKNEKGITPCHFEKLWMPHSRQIHFEPEGPGPYLHSHSSKSQGRSQIARQAQDMDCTLLTI